MKVRYNKDLDTLLIELTKKKVDDAFETDNMIVHVGMNKEPVLLEIFHASKFFEEEAKTLPTHIKAKFFSA